MLKNKFISIMKLSQDKMTDPLPVTEMNQLLDVLKSTGADGIDFNPVMGHPNYLVVSQQWAPAIHSRGMKVLWRSLHQNMKGLYNAPAYVGANRKPAQFWIDEAVKAAQLVKSLMQPGDEWAPYYEATEGVFSDSTAWIFDGLPGSYAQIFIDIANACKAVLPAGVVVGVSGNNASEPLNGWMPHSLSDYAGVVVIDEYTDLNNAKLDSDVRKVSHDYGKPVYIQETAASRDRQPTRAEADAFHATLKKLADDGILTELSIWGGWEGNPESIVSKTNGVYALNENGKSLQSWWTGLTPVPTPDPVPVPTPTPVPTTEKIIQGWGSTTAFTVITDKGNIWRYSSSKWTKLPLPF